MNAKKKNEMKLKMKRKMNLKSRDEHHQNKERI